MSIDSQIWGHTQRLSPVAFCRTQLPGGWCVNNAGFIHLREHEGILFDTFSTSAQNKRTRQVLDRLEYSQITVVNSHFHGDHTFGNYYYEDSKILATALTAREIINADLSLVGLWPEVDWGDDLMVHPPNQITPTEFTISGEGGPIVFKEYLNTHSPSDLIAWLPQDGVLYAGDIVWNGVTPFALMGSVTGSIATLEKLERLCPDTVVPGHGRVGDSSIIRWTMDYYKVILRNVEIGIREHKDPWHVAMNATLGEYREAIDSERCLANVLRAYCDLGALDQPDYMRILEKMRGWCDGAMTTILPQRNDHEGER